MFEDMIAKAAAGAMAGKMAQAVSQGVGAVQISFDKPKYSPAEAVSGKAVFILDSPKKIIGFQIMISGNQSREKFVNAALKESKSVKLMESQSFYARTEQIPSPEDRRGIIELPPGKYEIPFQFQLPGNPEQPPEPVEKKGMFGKSVEKWIYRPPEFQIMGILMSTGLSHMQGQKSVPVEWPYCEARQQAAAPAAKKDEWDDKTSSGGSGWDQDSSASSGGGGWDQDAPAASPGGGWDQDPSASKPDSMGGSPTDGNPKGGWD